MSSSWTVEHMLNFIWCQDTVRMKRRKELPGGWSFVSLFITNSASEEINPGRYELETEGPWVFQEKWKIQEEWRKATLSNWNSKKGKQVFIWPPDPPIWVPVTDWLQIKAELCNMGSYKIIISMVFLLILAVF